MTVICEQVARRLARGKPLTCKELCSELPSLSYMQVYNALANLRYQGFVQNHAKRWVLVKPYRQKREGRPPGPPLNLEVMREEVKQLRLLLQSAMHVLSTLEKKL